MQYSMGLLVMLSGWAAGDEAPAQTPAAQEQAMLETKGVIYLIDGVGGWGLSPKVMERTLHEAGVPHETRHFYWSHGYGRWHADLTDDDHLRRKGSELADAIMSLRVERSRSPIFVVAKSGGTAVALRALSELPEATVERAVLLSPAVSPNYDLSPCLRAVRTELVSFWSPRDRFILGFGTSVFGTADRVAGESAGLVGFRVPVRAEDPEAELYLKLRQVEWNGSMRKTWNFGTHIGTSMPWFIREYVSPLLGGQADVVFTETTSGDGGR